MLSRRNAAILTLVAGAAFIVSIIPLTLRIRDYNASANLTRFHAEIQNNRQFKLTGFPPVSISDAVDDRGLAAIKLEYGSTVRLLPIKAPPALNVPSLGIYGDWLKVLAINEVVRDAAGENAVKPGSEHLLIAIRQTPEGFDPNSWGSVRRAEWVFDFYDLKPDGQIELSTYRWPRSDRSEEGLHNRNLSDNPSPREIALEKLPVLKERTLQHFVAMHVIPKLAVPEHKFTDTALNPRILGWTLPASMLSFIAVVLGGFFAAKVRGK